MTTAGVPSRRSRALVALVVTLLVSATAACAGAGTGSGTETGTGSQSHTIIDWVDFVQLGDHQFLRAEPTVVIAEADLGQPVGTVRRELSTEDDVSPDHHPTDGESAFLPPGTRLFAVRKYAPDERIAAQTSDGWVAYDVYPPRRTPSPAA
jgi:hypothetical protein